MSIETKENAQKTQKSLEAAEPYLKNAEESSKKTGDKQLQQKVVKVREAIQEISQEIKKRLSDNS